MPDASHSGLALQRVVILRDGRPLIAVDARVAPGAVLTVMGPSGSGKSTLLSWMTGSLPSGFTATGRLILDGQDVTDLPPHRRGIGILFQDDILFPHLSVGGNLAFGLAKGAGSRRARVEAALAEVGLAGFADRDPATLSGGQKARVALMRMLLARPRAILLDEAFSGLDAELRARTRRLVFDMAAARKVPTVMVTHDAADAEAGGGAVITLA